jgi:hypothetical protein
MCIKCDLYLLFSVGNRTPCSTAHTQNRTTWTRVYTVTEKWFHASVLYTILSCSKAHSTLQYGPVSGHVTTPSVNALSRNSIQKLLLGLKFPDHFCKRGLILCLKIIIGILQNFKAKLHNLAEPSPKLSYHIYKEFCFIIHSGSGQARLSRSWQM